MSRDLTVVQPIRVREIADEAEWARLWAKTTRKIPLFVAKPKR
jgi:hypothetical protein